MEQRRPACHAFARDIAAAKIHGGLGVWYEYFEVAGYGIMGRLRSNKERNRS